MTEENVTDTLKRKPAVRWAVIFFTSYMAGFGAAPFGMLASAFGAPLAAMLLIQDRRNKMGKAAIQFSYALLAFYVAIFTSMLGMLSNPLWWQVTESSKHLSTSSLPLGTQNDLNTPGQHLIG
jgi:hypothetical protein